MGELVRSFANGRHPRCGAGSIWPLCERPDRIGVNQIQARAGLAATSSV